MVAERTRDASGAVLRRLARYRGRDGLDDLTGLRNQRALVAELQRRLPSCSPTAPLTVVMVDFDRFNDLNEHYGHAVGDAVLRAGARTMRGLAPSARLAFRYGGEEFVLLTPNGETDAVTLAERLRDQIAEGNGDLPAVTVSCGAAVLDTPVTAWVALDRADAALRAAKRAGRNRVVVAATEAEAENAYLVEELERETARRAAVAVAVATLEARDRRTADHSDDVLTLCESIGKRLGLEAVELEHLMAGAQLHDVGKVGVPSQILDKPGPLNDDEWAVIREHTVIGERILRSVPEMAEVATIVRHSHEHWDGSGYPDGLKGHGIPLASRIILCADAFHAIRCDRPYRAGRSADEAIAELRTCAGSQFDAVVVEALGEVAEELRRRQERGTGRIAPPRTRRLAVLLATLAVGGGTAGAASPEIRDAVRSLVGAAPAPAPDPAPGAARGFTFGPLGDALSIEPVAGGQNVPRAVTVNRIAASREAAEPVADSPLSGSPVFGSPVTDSSGLPDNATAPAAGTHVPATGDPAPAPPRRAPSQEKSPAQTPAGDPPAQADPPASAPGRPESPGNSNPPGSGRDEAPGQEGRDTPPSGGESPGNSQGNGNSENAGPPTEPPGKGNANPPAAGNGQGPAQANGVSPGPPSDPGEQDAAAPGRGNGPKS